MPIPLELIDIIITELALEGDFESVRACSLVGTQLLHSCRKNLFSSIRLIERDGTPRLTAKFTALLDGNPALAAYVRDFELTLAMEYPTTGRLSFLQPLTHVDVFQFRFRDFSGENADQMEWSSLSDAFKGSLTAFMQSNGIRELRLGGLARLPRSIFHLCRFLRKVALLQVTPGMDDKKEGTGLPLVVPLQSLELWGPMPLSRTAPLIGVFDVANLGALSINTQIDEEDLGSIQRLLPQCGSLQELIMRPGGFGWHPPILKDVGRTMPLKTLRRLRIGVVSHDLDQMPPYGLFEDELGAMSGANVLETLRFDITSVFAIQLDYTPALWDKLDEVLSVKSGFPSLRQVEIHVRVHHYGIEDDDIVKETERNLGYISSTNFQWLKKNTEFTFQYSFTFIE